jgi:hypothetical protein
VEPTPLEHSSAAVALDRRSQEARKRTPEHVRRSQRNARVPIFDSFSNLVIVTVTEKH